MFEFDYIQRCERCQSQGGKISFWTRARTHNRQLGLVIDWNCIQSCERCQTQGSKTFCMSTRTYSSLCSRNYNFLNKMVLISVTNRVGHGYSQTPQFISDRVKYSSLAACSAMTGASAKAAKCSTWARIYLKSIFSRIPLCEKLFFADDGSSQFWWTYKGLIYHANYHTKNQKIFSQAISWVFFAE